MSANTETENDRPDDSTESDDERDLVAELDRPHAGEHGVPVDAVCVGCNLTRAKRAPPETVDGDRLGSFKHTCPRCRQATFWNVLRDLTGDSGGSA